MFTSVAIIGFGEVGRIFARDMRAKGGVTITAFDTVTVAPAEGVTFAASAVEAVQHAELVISSVTAGSALAALEAALPGLAHGPFVLDVNSVSPGTKQKTAAAVTAAGGRYVEAAVMTSVPPKGLASPMWLGGVHATDFIAAADQPAACPAPSPVPRCQRHARRPGGARQRHWQEYHHWSKVAVPSARLPT